MPGITLPLGELIPGFVLDEDGRSVPQKITIGDFRRYFLDQFPKLGDEGQDGLIQDAIDTVYAIFTGVQTLWDMHKTPVWYDKTQTCYRLLTAWYLADLYPSFVAGIPTMGGIPLKRKKIDGVDLTFANGASSTNKNYEDLLDSLNSNPWGRKARLMIKASANRVILRNRIII
jgi:hypothetical protein